jgi:hypothetical protein
MDEAKLALAVNWLRSVVEKARISPSVTNFELADLDNGRYRLTSEMAGAEKTLHLSAEELEAIADGDETILESVKARLLRLVRM